MILSKKFISFVVSISILCTMLTGIVGVSAETVTVASWDYTSAPSTAVIPAT